MRRLLALAAIGGVIFWWLRGHRRVAAHSSVTIGYADGSAVTLDPGSPELDRLLQIAAAATAP